MKFKKSFLLSAFAAFLLAGLVSCGNDDDDGEIVIPYAEVVPSKITYTYSRSLVNTTSVVYQFEYDEQGRISQFHSEYFDNGISRGFVATTMLKYEGTTLEMAMTRTDFPDGEIIYSRRFFLWGSEIHTGQNDNNPYKLDLLYRVLRYATHDSGMERFRREFEYDMYGNAKFFTWHPNEDETTQRFFFRHDTNNGIFRNVKTPAWFITTQIDMGGLEYRNLTHNCTQGYDVSGSVQYVFENTYNSNNYPEKIKRTSNIDDEEILSYEIEYYNLE